MITSILIIDPQNDFCIPGAPLYIKGADTDMHKLSTFITENASKIDEIYVSLDMHLVEDIAHANYWINSENKNPSPFSTITVEDVENGVWKTANPKNQDSALKYLRTLKNNKRFTHTIWPNHCIAGSNGANIFPTLYAALRNWMDVNKKTFKVYIKGMDQNSEHFGMFQPENGEEFNHDACHEIFNEKDVVLVVGQAKSHCVATSLRQILDVHPYNVKKITLLTDTTSNVAGFENIADEIYANLKHNGMNESTTEEYFKVSVTHPIE